MPEEYEKLLLTVEELKIKIPSLLDLLDEIIAHETRFKSIDEKSDSIIDHLKLVRKELGSLQLDNKALSDLVKDDNNVSIAILLCEKILDRKDAEIKKYMKSCFCTPDLSEFIGNAFIGKKKEIAKIIWDSLEEKLQLYIGKRVLAGSISIGVILGIIFMIFSFIQKYLV